MKKFTIAMLTVFFGLTAFAQGPKGTQCTDASDYVSSKDIGSTGAYTLQGGILEHAAQTYHYNGTGVLTNVRIYGNKPFPFYSTYFWVKIYNVDANNRPTSLIAQRWMRWSGYDQSRGYDDISFSPGVNINGNFAVALELQSGNPLTTFQLDYNGDGEGNGEDLASLAGTSTGYNWTSAKDNHSKDGDFYLIPTIRNHIQSSFTQSSMCISTGSTVGFSNQTVIDTAGMFNLIKWSGYGGSNTVYEWKVNGTPVGTGRDLNYTFSTPGVFTVTLETTYERWNNSSCSNTASTQVSVGLAAIAGNVVNVTCNGGNNGSMTAAGSGGATPYIYSLDGSSWTTNATFSNLAAGIYTLYVQDALGCNANKSFTITEPTQLVFNSVNTTSTSCGSSNGGILASASGGTGALQYSIDGINYQSSGSFTGLPSGSYNVHVKDANGCITTQYVVISNSAGPQITSLTYNNVSCHGYADGSITVTSTGGSGAPQYSIDGGNTWQSSGTFTGLTAGGYAVLVKDQAGCIDGRRISIYGPTDLMLTASADSVSCNGGSDGVITVTSSIGGTGTHSYSVDGINFQSGTVFSGLAAGNYTVTVKDVAGCTDTVGVTIPQPSVLAATVTITNVTCYGEGNGIVQVNGTGGTGSYDYSINGGNTWQTSDVFNGLEAGTYTITVRDHNGCTTTVQATVTQPAQITATINMGQATCGSSNGNLGVVAAGGSGSGYLYSIDFGANWNSSGNFTGLAAGNYTIVIQDGSGCYESFTATVTTTSGPTINSVNGTNVTCNGGSDGTITVNATSSFSLTYSLNGGAYQSSNVFTNVAAGAHTVSVKDAVGCIDTANVTLTEPNAIAISVAVTNVACNGAATGSAVVTASGGIGTLAYSLDGINFQSSNTFSGLVAGSYIVTVKDAGSCENTMAFVVTEPNAILSTVGILHIDCHGNSSGALYASAGGGTGALQFSLDNINYQTHGTFTGLAAGTYTVYIKDQNGCVVSSTHTIIEPAVLSLSANTSDVACAGGNDGVIDLSVTGGTAPFTFQWSNGPTTEDIFNLAAGSYTVTVTDYNGCVQTMTYTITQPSNPIIINGTITPATGPTNADGAVDATISGGTTPYTYAWSPGGQTTEDISGLLPGVYTLTVTDFQGCQISLGFTVSWNVGIGDVNITDELKLFPNPTNHTLNIQVDQEHTIETARVVNLLGSIVHQVQPNSNAMVIDVNNWSSGTYFIQLVIDGQSITRRFEVYR